MWGVLTLNGKSFFPFPEILAVDSLVDFGAAIVASYQVTVVRGVTVLKHRGVPLESSSDQCLPNSLETTAQTIAVTA
jgi:hypothetical protein